MSSNPNSPLILHVTGWKLSQWTALLHLKWSTCKAGLKLSMCAGLCIIGSRCACRAACQHMPWDKRGAGTKQSPWRQPCFVFAYRPPTSPPPRWRSSSMKSALLSPVPPHRTRSSCAPTMLPPRCPSPLYPLSGCPMLPQKYLESTTSGGRSSCTACAPLPPSGWNRRRRDLLLFLLRPWIAAPGDFTNTQTFTCVGLPNMLNVVTLSQLWRGTRLLILTVPTSVPHDALIRFCRPYIQHAANVSFIRSVSKCNVTIISNGVSNNFIVGSFTSLSRLINLGVCLTNSCSAVLMDPLRYNYQHVLCTQLSILFLVFVASAHWNKI